MRMVELLGKHREAQKILATTGKEPAKLNP